MLLGRGQLIETVEARVKTLERILKDYILKKFTGYVIFRNDVRGIYVSIAMVEGYLAACRSIDEGAVHEGGECCRIARKYLNEPEGIIEVHNVPFDIIVLDIVMFPMSRIERDTTLSPILGATVGIPEAVTVPPTPQVLAPVVTLPKEEMKEEVEVVVPKAEILREEVPKEEVVQPIPSLTTPTTPPTTPTEIVQEKPAEITITNECIDPVTLYIVLKSAQLLESLPNPVSFEEVVNKIKNVVKEKKLSYGYVSGNIENLMLRILYDSQSNNIYIEMEKEGLAICGNNAKKEIESKSISNVKIWIAQ